MRLGLPTWAIVALIFTSITAVALGQDNATSSNTHENAKAEVDSGGNGGKPRIRRDISNRLAIWRMGMESSGITAITDVADFSTDHYSINVWNIGKVPLRAESLYGTYYGWYDVIQGAELQPGQSARLSVSGYYSYTGLKIYTPWNKENLPSMYYAYRGSGDIGLKTPSNIPGKFIFNYDEIDIMEMYLSIQILGLAFSSNFFAGFAGQLFLDSFFPKKTKDPWDDIKGKVETLIKESQIVVINAMLENDIKPIDAQIKDVMSETDNPDFRLMYNSLLGRMVGIERKFVFNSQGLDYRAVNLHILPLFTRVINLKLCLHSFAMTYSVNLTFNKYDIRRMNKLTTEVVDFAVEHIESVAKERIESAYTEADTFKLYDYYMNIRTTVAIHGRQYYPTWFKALDPNNKTTSDHILAYSPYYGSSTPSMWMQAIVKFGEPPLTPPMTPDENGNLKIPVLKEITIFFLEGNDRKPLIGLELSFDGGKTALAGQKSNSNSKFDVHPNLISKVQVAGKGIINCLIIYLSDGNKHEFGWSCNDYVNVFELADHHIVGFFVSSDNNRGDNRAVNMAVSYAENPDHDSAVKPQLEKVKNAKE